MYNKKKKVISKTKMFINKGSITSHNVEFV